MKKIIIAAVILMASSTVKAQEVTEIGSAQKQSVKGQGGEPICNGMLYSQWKAKCTAEKAQQEQQARAAQVQMTKQESAMQSISGSTQSSGRVLPAVIPAAQSSKSAQSALSYDKPTKPTASKGAATAPAAVNKAEKQ